MTTPPNFGGREIEEGLQEDLGAPREDHRAPRRPGHDTGQAGDHEAHGGGQACGRCGAVITAGQEARRRADGTWVHEVCPERR